MTDIFRRFKRQFNIWIHSLRRVKKTDKFFAIFLLTIWVIIIVGYFIPVNFVFEGNLIVESLNFTYNGNNEKLFLQNIDSIKSIDLQGKLEQPIALSGKFSSDNDTSVQEKLAKLNTLTIELPFPESRFIVTQQNNLETTEISLVDLRIKPETKINQLAYNFPNNSLSFCLNSAKSTTKSCRYTENIKPSPIGKLRLELGQEPIEIQLRQINIPELNIKADQNNLEELIVQFIPDNNETINITLLAPNELLITLPKSEKNENSATWFRKDIDVTNVNFIRYETTAQVIDEIETSTILKGEIRIGKKKIELQNNQFLIINSQNSGIKKIRSLAINANSPKANSPKANSPQGIQTFIIGESTGIAVGLYPDFPVETIQPNLLSKHLSSEAISAIIGFLSALTGILLPRIFLEASDD